MTTLLAERRAPALASGRASRPAIGDDVVRELAIEQAVCVRPVVRRVTDRATGVVTTVAIRCGSTRESRCPSCASNARRLRMTQCAEGWHAAVEPAVDPATVEHAGGPDSCPAEENDAGEQEDVGDEVARQTRSTRRRADAPDLPTRPVENRTVGRTFTAPDGKMYQPSMFVTLTLPSYGKVRPFTGAPVDPARYDYRRAALDALHFSKLLDRWVQNLRRCAGYRAQYFGAVEAQRRLAPHFHVAIRGAIPRATLRAVTKATYFQLWWPQMETPVYDHRLPVWDGADYRDPDTGMALPTWQQAVDALGDELPGTRPAHVMRLGSQVDIKGIVGGTPDADRAVRYLTKYLTKAVAETYADDDAVDVAYEAHIDRLHHEVRWLPCSKECANWLRFGVQPYNAGPGLVPGRCPAKAHDREHLGVGGRRVLVSRSWSGKTLTEHRADRAAVVRAALQAAGIEAPAAERMAAEVLHTDGLPRYTWQDVPVSALDYARVVMGSVVEARRWRAEYERAREVMVGAAVCQRAGPPVAAVDSLSAEERTERERGRWQ
ncbi:replication initiator [uncultured Cellulomonas sp.]|uniref:replication initiator n=1 Tax=uncultured Cellulomonas sp. TaxID=189682 RepID=UPI002619CBE2|nr:replication initiator [uncultured Cellulomonas sp.]